jgi:pimeloyl-ACP methyl ester carboxylesterase
MEYFSATNSKKSPTLVFLHGWGGSWASWSPVLERLKTDFNLFAFDLPGFGNQPIQIPYYLDNYVDFVTNILKTRKIKKPILIGHSFGGAVISKIAAENLYPIKKLILIDAAAIRHPYSFRQKITLKIVSSVKKILSLPLIRVIMPPIQKLYYHSTNQQNSDYAALKGNPIMQKTFQHVIKDDLSSLLTKIKTPTLIIWGENDLSTPLTDGQKINSLITNSKLIIYPNSTHFSYLENQDIFISDVKKFIQK